MAASVSIPANIASRQTIRGRVEASTGIVLRHFEFNDFNDLRFDVGPCVNVIVGPHLSWRLEAAGAT